MPGPLAVITDTGNVFGADVTGTSTGQNIAWPGAGRTRPFVWSSRSQLAPGSSRPAARVILAWSTPASAAVVSAMSTCIAAAPAASWPAPAAAARRCRAANRGYAVRSAEVTPNQPLQTPPARRRPP